MKSDNPTAEEIRAVIDALVEGRYIAAEHSDLPKEVLDAGAALFVPILRYALRCRLEDDRAAAATNGSEVR